jgi:hypothetical protein
MREYPQHDEPSERRGRSRRLFLKGVAAGALFAPPLFAEAARGASSSPPAPNAPITVGAVIFQDYFASLDTTKWAPDWFGPNNVQNNVACNPANVSVFGGVAALKLSSHTAGALMSTNPNGGANPGFQFSYGYAEAKISFPGRGSTIYNWPAFWTNGQNWATDGEIDVAEGLGTLTSNYHSAAGADNSGPVPGNWGGTWHTYGVNRQPGKNDIYWDGQLVRSYATYDAGSPHYLVLNNGRASGRAVIGATVRAQYVCVWAP